MPGPNALSSATTSTSWLTCSGASVGVSISTQRRMPSRIGVASKGLAVVMSYPIPPHLPMRNFAPGNDGIFQNTKLSNRCGRKSARVGAVARRDLLDQLDDGPPHFGIGDARERARQRETLRCREEIGHIGRGSAFAEARAIHRAARPAIEQKRHRYLQYFDGGPSGTVNGAGFGEGA